MVEAVNTIHAVEDMNIDVPTTEPQEEAIRETPEKGTFDCIIIGGGPAGITAGIYLARKRINTLLISPELGGQVSWTAEIENYPGYNIISGYELAEQLKDQLMKLRLYLRIGDKVVAMDYNKNGGGTVRTKKGAEYTFKSLIVASGKRSRPLDVPGEKEFTGKGVTFCATCDGPLYKGETVMVVGGGNSGLSAANDLLKLDCTVHLVDIMPDLKADAILIEKVKAYDSITFHQNHAVKEIMGDKSVSGVKIQNRESGEEQVIDVSGIFIEIGLLPNSSFALGKLGMNDRKEILVNCRCMTDKPGVFAAGDVTNVPNKQIVIAAGEGAKAALMVNNYLINH